MISHFEVKTYKLSSYFDSEIEVEKRSGLNNSKELNLIIPEGVTIIN